MITRVELIGPEGRLFSQWFDEGLEARAALQDDDRTLKIFLDRPVEEEQ